MIRGQKNGVDLRRLSDQLVYSVGWLCSLLPLVSLLFFCFCLIFFCSCSRLSLIISSLKVTLLSYALISQLTIHCFIIHSPPFCYPILFSILIAFPFVLVLISHLDQTCITFQNLTHLTIRGQTPASAIAASHRQATSDGDDQSPDSE